LGHQLASAQLEAIMASKADELLKKERKVIDLCRVLKDLQ
jgi:hypothetical protein